MIEPVTTPFARSWTSWLTREIITHNPKPSVHARVPSGLPRDVEREEEQGMSQGLPGLTRIDHAGLTIPDLEDAVAFYTGVLGGTELYRLGPFDAAEIPSMPDGRD